MTCAPGPDTHYRVPARPSYPCAVLDLESVSGELVAWLEQNWDPEQSLLAWRRRLYQARWAAPAWPVEWGGRGWPDWTEPVVARSIVEFGAAGIPGRQRLPAGRAHHPDPRPRSAAGPVPDPDPHRRGDLVPAVQRARRGLGSGRACTTRAELDGDEWVVNGQKVWNTSAHHADFGHAAGPHRLGRPQAPGHHLLRAAMHQPGVEVRPLRQMNGHASFNEVFLTDARVAASTTSSGEVGEGWRVALTTLAYERRFGAIRRAGYDPPGPAGRWTRPGPRPTSTSQPYVWYPQRAGRVDLVIERARASRAGRRPGRPAGHRPAADAAAGQRLDGRAGPGRPGSWAADRARRARSASWP